MFLTLKEKERLKARLKVIYKDWESASKIYAKTRDTASKKKLEALTAEYRETLRKSQGRPAKVRRRMILKAENLSYKYFPHVL